MATLSLCLQPLPQQFSKEMVIAVPTPLVVQGTMKEVGMFEIFRVFCPKQWPRIRTAAQRATMRSRMDVRNKKVWTVSVAAPGLLQPDSPVMK